MQTHAHSADGAENNRLRFALAVFLGVTSPLA
jgi:hypothetical protein